MLVRSVDPLDIQRLPVPAGLHVVVVTPAFELPTRRAREALPDAVPMDTLVRNGANLAALIHALHTGDLELLGRALDDEIVTPARMPLIPGCEAVMRAARESGALGSSISGAGPSVFALCAARSEADAIAASMRDAFEEAGLSSTVTVSPADCPGARIL